MYISVIKQASITFLFIILLSTAIHAVDDAKKAGGQNCSSTQEENKEPEIDSFLPPVKETLPGG